MDKKKLLIALGLVCGAYLAYGYFAQPTVGPEYVARFVSGTEYQVGEVGQTVVRLTDRQGIGVSSDYCNVSIWFPNKTIWYNMSSMASGGADGSWYLEWTTANQIGVYEEYAECVKGTKTYGVSSSFHVSEALTALNESLEEPVLVIVA